MDELESQIAKIQLGRNKTSSSFIYLMAEKAPASSAELYVVAELPLFNPAAEEACERICLAIASTLKRAYKKSSNENSFENAISLINEELGKLAELGQTQWIDKLNCILAAKEGHTFHIASCGKVSAFMLRSSEYTDISCSAAQSHPLKTFENYASGKIRLGDLLILSTTQLFNYLSMDRLLKIVSSADFLTATKTVIELLKANSDPQISFGVLLNLQVPVGETPEQEEDLENYLVEKPAGGQINLLGQAAEYLKTAFAMDKNKRRPHVSLPKISLTQKIKNFSGGTKNLLAKSRGVWQNAKSSAQNVKNAANPQKLRALSPQKKFFLISAAVLLVAVIFSISVAVRVKTTTQAKNQISSQLKSAQDLVLKAQSALLYKQDGDAANYLTQAKSQLPDAKKVDSSNNDLYTKILGLINDTQTQMERITETPVVNLGSLGSGENLISLPEYSAVQINQAIISYNKQNSKIEDSAISAPIKILDSVYTSGSSAAIYDGTNLYLWDFSKGSVGQAEGSDMPQTGNFGGMAAYPTNKRVYIVNKNLGEIVSYLPASNALSRPIVSVTDPGLSQARDIAIGIDGSIYVLEKNQIAKFQNGRPANFTLNLPTALSGNGKIFTQKTFTKLYVLDPGNNRILILDKSGDLLSTLKSSQFTQLKAFEVDEKNKIAYVLNGSDLLKVTLP